MGDVLILAHRGLPATGRPENTVAAVAAAFHDGADGVEVDVRLTADGVLAVSHDADLGRLTGVSAPVAGMLWPALQDTAARHGLHLARVEQVLSVADGRRVVLELKPSPVGVVGETFTAQVLVRELRTLQRAGLELDVTVSSFSPGMVAAVCALAPAGVRTALLGRATNRASSVLRRAREAGHDEVHPHVLTLLAEPRVVADAHACGIAVVPWTVNRPRQLSRLQQLGVDAIITDVPVLARVATAMAAA